MSLCLEMSPRAAGLFDRTPHCPETTMFKPASIAAAAVLSAALPAEAIGRYNSTAMSCDRVQATIAADGAAIMRYRSKRSPGLPLYGRYVDDGRFCGPRIRPHGVHSCPRYGAVPGVDECWHFDFDDRDELFRHRHERCRQGAAPDSGPCLRRRLRSRSNANARCAGGGGSTDTPSMASSRRLVRAPPGAKSRRSCCRPRGCGGKAR